MTRYIFASGSTVPALAAALFVAALLSSCTVTKTGQIVVGPPTTTARSKWGVAGSSATSNEPGRVGTSSPYYSMHHYTFVDEDLLSDLNPANARIEIDLGEQRARVFRSGGKKGKNKGDALVIETQISTGKQGHNTPNGSFKILEKSTAKKSNLYGKWIDSESGAVLKADGDSREPPGSPNAKFVGTPMPYWLRVTPGGVGMHIGFVPDYPASHGCIRVPKAVQPLIYEKVGVGTPVTITH